MTIKAVNLKSKIGSGVKVELDALIAGAFASQLRDLLVARGVLVFRDLGITLDQQRDITATLGRLHIPANGDPLQKITRDEKESAEYAAFFPATFFWHMDGHYHQTVPCFAASLRPARLPAEGGGQTEFLNTYAAYEDLAEEDKRLVDGLRVLHSRVSTMSRVRPDATEQEALSWRSTPTAIQPLVWQHASGRKSLMLGNSVACIEGMHPADSNDLLIRLRSHMMNPEYIYTHEWQMNDLVFWDNTGTMHRARPFDPNSPRLLTRFTLDGEESIRAPAPALRVQVFGFSQ
jgi:alpha-ketoglutarate-dependent taurine dioxygenase